ncbi:unnamed protein product, partial [Rotaria sp. Silwood1]
MSATDSTFRVEYAKSDRSKCKSCWSSIDTDSFRFTFMTYSSKFDAKEDQDKIRHRIQENATALSKIDYKQHSNDDDDIQKALNNSNAKNCSHLPSPVQDLIRLIFNIETMKETLLAFEIDLTKMPL